MADTGGTRGAGRLAQGAYVPGERLRYAGWIAFGIAAILYYPRATKNVVNLAVYVQGAQCYWDGRALLDCAPAFTYPPAVAFAALPLVPLSQNARLLVWYGLSLAAFLVCVVLCERLARRLYPAVTEPANLLWLRLVTFVLVLKFVLVVLAYQSYDLLVLGLILGGLAALLTGQQVASGAALALATAFKATPLIFLPCCLVKRRFAAAVVMAIGIALFSLLPDLVSFARGLRGDYFASWVERVAGPALTPGGKVNLHFWQGWMGASLDNLSLRGVLNRLASGPVLGLPPRVVLGIAFAIVCAAIALLILRSPRTKRMLGIDGAVLLIGTLAPSPISSRYHFILLLLPYTMLVAAALCDSGIRTLAIWTLVASFILVTGTSNDLTGQTLAEFAHGFGFMLIGSLILLIPLGAIARRERVQAPAS